MPTIANFDDRCPYPVGTVVVFWNFNTLSGIPASTGYKGIVEEHNGKVYIRFLNEDGTPGSWLEPLHTAPILEEEPQRWYREGDRP